MFHPQTVQLNASIGALLYCCAYLFNTTPGGLCVCADRPHIQVSSHPTPSRGPHACCACRAQAVWHVMMCHARALGRKGVLMLHHQAFQLYASMAALTPR